MGSFCSRSQKSGAQALPLQVLLESLLKAVSLGLDLIAKRQSNIILTLNLEQRIKLETHINLELHLYNEKI